LKFRARRRKRSKDARCQSDAPGKTRNTIPSPSLPFFQISNTTEADAIEVRPGSSKIESEFHPAEPTGVDTSIELVSQRHLSTKPQEDWENHQPSPMVERNQPSSRGPPLMQHLKPVQWAGYDSRTTTSSRGSTRCRYFCPFSRYGCHSHFLSKYCWRDHILSHLQLNFYRCAECFKVQRRSDFRAKGGFVRHIRTVHNSVNAHNLEVLLVESLIPRRARPKSSLCGFCCLLFEGEDSWSRPFMEHVEKHWEAQVDPHTEIEDNELTSWALREGIIQDCGDGNYSLARGEFS
jgi:hypothetical protein